MFSSRSEQGEQPEAPVGYDRAGPHGQRYQAAFATASTSTNVIDDKLRPELDVRVYVDSRGQVLKSEQDVMGGIVYYRTTKEAALAPGGPVQFDLILKSVIKTSSEIPDPDGMRNVEYRELSRIANPPRSSRLTFARPSGQDGTKGSAVLEVQERRSSGRCRLRGSARSAICQLPTCS